MVTSSNGGVGKDAGTSNQPGTGSPVLHCRQCVMASQRVLIPSLMLT